MTKKIIGIRHEDKYLMERRCAIIPALIKRIVNTSTDVEFQIEKSEKRIFTADDFTASGAVMVDDARHADVIFGVKEINENYFLDNKTYVFFSHVIKGQAYNMPMLKTMMAHNCNLIDYEKVEDETGKRLIFFGRFAGLAGMINSLWSLGQRLKVKGIETPFLKIKQSFRYNSLDEARAAVSETGFDILKNGLPETLCPLVVGFTGYGNVSNGAQEILNLLPVQEISPERAMTLHTEKNLPKNIVFKVVFKEKDMVNPVQTGAAFDLQDYYSNPNQYHSIFEQYIPHLTVLMNCMYWDVRYPRIVTKKYLKENYTANPNQKLLVVGDVTCDPDGSIEATHKGTPIEEPVFVYNPFTDKPTNGFEGEGLLIMAVDILPSELPREASETFAEALKNYVLPIAKADYSVDFDNLELPAPIKRAMILHKGELTPSYKYIQKYL